MITIKASMKAPEVAYLQRMLRMGMYRVYEDRIQKWINHNGKAFHDNGALFENFVAQELYAAGYELYYYKKKNMGEVDFIIDREDIAVPMEVKSGNDYRKHAALDHLLENYHFDKAYVLYPGNTENKGNITYLPIYMAGLSGVSENASGDITIPAL